MTTITDSIMDVSLAEIITANNANSAIGSDKKGIDIQPQDIIERFIFVYQKLNKGNLELLGDIYAEDIHFSDPLHKIARLPALTSYFETLYLNVESIDFVIHQVVREDGVAALKWTMNLVHPKLNSGNGISVEGMSLLSFSDKIYQHQDYFDLGAMIYEQLPIVGGLIGFIKSKVAK